MAALPPDEFKQAVYDLTRLIPKGRVSTYGAIARCIGAVHFPAEAPMAEQLRAEGVEVVDDQVVGFDGVFWDPWEAGEW
jgi:methylated-DNA-protein-cysteine methyltransferase-like protein